MSSEAPRPRRGMLLVISSPSGAGKTSLSRQLLAAHAELTPSVSVTTRAPRPGEKDGREYHFVDWDTFARLREEDAFLEWAEVHEHAYGSPRAPVMAHLAEGRDVLFDIDWQGAKAVKAAAAEDVVSIFILPPSMAELSRRLHARAQDAEDVITRRLGRARGEISHWREYDYVLLNDDFETAYLHLSQIYQAERLRRARNPWVEPFVDRLLAHQD